MIILCYLGKDEQDSSKTSGIIAGSVIGGVLFLICMCGMCVTGIYLCTHFIHGQPLRPNKIYVCTGHRVQSNVSDKIFQTGSFLGYYYKDGIWNGSDQYEFILHSQVDHTLHGKGTDDKGTFVINGIFSPRTLRMAFNKKYQSGCEGDVLTNSTIQVQWNPATQNFQGKYYLKAGQRGEEGKYVIQLKDSNETHF